MYVYYFEQFFDITIDNWFNSSGKIMIYKMYYAVEY